MKKITRLLSRHKVTDVSRGEIGSMVSSPQPPAGFTFLIGADGAYLIGLDGARLIGAL